MILKDVINNILWKHMSYKELQEQLRDFSIFSLADIRKVEPDFDRRRLNEWQNKSYIKNVRRGYYMFVDTQLNEEKLFLIANKIYNPSYVSLEMALSYYGLIPEGVYSITSITTKKTEKFKTPIAEFSYRNVKPQLFFGYTLVIIGRQQYKLAEMEKAVLDYLYLNHKSTNKADLEEWRFESKGFLAQIDQNKFNRYLTVFNSPALEKRVKQFMNFIKQQD
jgi:predicted transcriptional regulator of viral defense system